MNNHEIDKLVAKHVMGWDVQVFENIDVTVADAGDVFLNIPEDFSPSNRIQDAWLVVEKLSENFGVVVYQDLGAPSECHLHQFTDEPVFSAESETVLIAICSAALKSAGVEVS